MIGELGEIHPNVVDAYGLSGRVVAGEFDLEELLLEPGPWQFAAPSAFPPVVFDLAFALDADVPASILIDAVREAGSDLVEDVRVFDVFTGASIGEGRRSVAVNICLSASDRTLTDAAVTPIRQATAARVVKRTGGELRRTA